MFPQGGCDVFYFSLFVEVFCFSSSSCAGSGSDFYNDLHVWLQPFFTKLFMGLISYIGLFNFYVDKEIVGRIMSYLPYLSLFA